VSNQLKVLALTRYNSLGASTRLRCLQFVPHLQARGIAIDHCALLSNAYLQRFYAGERTQLISDVLKPIARRIITMLSAQNYDVIWLEKEAFPYFPWFLEALTWMRLPPVMVDYDDAIFHTYDQNKRSAVRMLLGRKIDSVMAASRITIAGNSYLAARAVQAGAQQVEIIPTVLDPQRYQSNVPKLDSKFRIGWVGTKSTSGYLSQIAPALARAERELGAEVIVIGAKTVNIPGVNPTLIDWTEQTEAQEIEKLNVGLMPLSDTPWERGKCGYKLLQYMACGLPVVASPIGANNDIVTEGQTGFLPRDNAAWFEAFKTIHDNKNLALAMGAAGRNRVERSYSIQAILPKIESCLWQASKSLNS
jgi:glycosyltransferase involved in cell wall biosynthesis